MVLATGFLLGLTSLESVLDLGKSQKFKLVLSN